MYCKNCGSEIPEGALFCSKCGTPVEKTSNNTNNNPNKLSEATNGTSNKRKKRKKSTLSKIILVLFPLLFVTTIALSYFEYIEIPLFSDCFRRMRINDMVNNMEDDESKADFIEAEEYFSNNSQLLDVIKVTESADLNSESDAMSNYDRRGFNKFPPYSEYDLEGNIYEAEKISNSSNEMHPLYAYDYESPNGDLWTVCLVNNDFMALPISFNYQSTLNAKLIISETEHMTVYDSQTNSFYINIPNEAQVIIKKVDNITTDLLDSLSVEVLANEYE